MTATVQSKNGRANYFIVLSFKDTATQKFKTKWVGTDIPVKGNNKRLANEKLKEVLAEYERKSAEKVNINITINDRVADNDEKTVEQGSGVLFTDFLKKWLEFYELSSQKNVNY